MDIPGLEEVALQAILKTGNHLLKNLENLRKVEEKDGLELVSDADIQAQHMIINILKKTGIQVVAEEGAEQETDTCWLVDPIDGTTNYIHGVPIFAISIGLKMNGKIKLGVIHAPYLNETFQTIEGQGAYLNNKQISVSSTSRIGDALLATGFPYDLRTSQNNNFKHFQNFSYHARAIRRLGSAALDLAYVACGRIDGFWELKLRSWDTAAGMLLVNESGGEVTDFSGDAFQPGMQEILASNGKIHEQMVNILHSAV